MRFRRKQPERTDEQVISEFNRIYYDSMVYMDTPWLGVNAQKCPMDLWTYQEILFSKRPDLVIETGTYGGGSALFLASICDLIGNGRVISVDISPQSPLPEHPRISYMSGRSSTDKGVIEEVRRAADNSARVMVILDSDHSRDHVIAELELYSPLVTVGQYLVVEDTNINGHPVLADFGPGPMEAVAAWLPTVRGWVHDTRPERFMVTFNPSGYLLRQA